jgi:hypothetical protein
MDVLNRKGSIKKMKKHEQKELSTIGTEVMAALEKEVMVALEETADGLPFAGPTAVMENGEPVWRRPAGWTQEDFALNYERYLRRGDEATAAKIAAACRERYGAEPSSSPAS